MKRTSIYLPDEVHNGLKKLAFESNISVAELIRLAIDKAYGDDIADIRDMEEEIAGYRAHPESAISLNEIKKLRL